MVLDTGKKRQGRGCSHNESCLLAIGVSWWGDEKTPRCTSEKKILKEKKEKGKKRIAQQTQDTHGLVDGRWFISLQNYFHTSNEESTGKRCHGILSLNRQAKVFFSNRPGVYLLDNANSSPLQLV